MRLGYSPESTRSRTRQVSANEENMSSPVSFLPRIAEKSSEFTFTRKWEMVAPDIPIRESGESMSVKKILALSLVLWALVFATVPANAIGKNDVVMMKNRDRLTGEIKGLSHGLLEFKSEYMASSVQLDWQDVERLLSPDLYIVTLVSGQDQRTEQFPVYVGCAVRAPLPASSVQLRPI